MDNGENIAYKDFKDANGGYWGISPYNNSIWCQRHVKMLGLNGLKNIGYPSSNTFRTKYRF